MKLKSRQRIKLSVRRILLVAGAFSFLLAAGIILFINLSDKREARAAVMGDYRSKASGNWNSASTWERYNGSAWIPASRSPALLDGVIEIQNGHSVIVMSSDTADQVLVDAGGNLTVSQATLTINNGSGTDIAVNGMLNINGNVNMLTNASGVISGLTFCQLSGSVNINQGASVTINNGGLFELDGGSVTTAADKWIVNTGGTYRHNTDGGIIPLAAWRNNSNCEITGVTFTIPSNLNQSFSNFAWSCASQAANVNASGNLQTVDGDFRMTSTGIGSLIFNSSANAALAIGGNYYQDGGTVILTKSGRTDVNIAGDVFITDGALTFTEAGSASISVNGNMIMSGGVIDMSQYAGTEPAKGTGTLYVKSDFSNTGGEIRASSTGTGHGVIAFAKSGTQTYGGYVAFGDKIDFTVLSGSNLDLITTSIKGGRNFTLNSGGGLIIGDANGICLSAMQGSIQTNGARDFSKDASYTYNSSVAQVTGNAIPSVVANLRLNNPNGLSLNKSVTVQGTLDLASGNINTLADTLGLGTNLNGGVLARANNTITGWFKRWIFTTALSDYLFPVAYNGYKGVKVCTTNFPSQGGYLTLHFTPNYAGSEGLPLADAGVNIADVASEGYWTISPDDKLKGGTYSLDVSVCAFADVDDYTSLRLVQRKNTESKWKNSGTHAATTGSNTNAVVHRLAIHITDFGDFAVGGKKFADIPLQILSFTAEREDNIVKVLWTTQNEVNSDYFTVQRSADGDNFLPIDTVHAAGNSSSVINYKSIDVKPVKGLNYYRLKETMYGGRTAYSQVVPVKFDESLIHSFIAIESISPIPFYEEFTIQYNVAFKSMVTIMIYNSAGQIVLNEKMLAERGHNSFQFTEHKNMMVGIYYISVSTYFQTITQKILKSS